MSMNKSNTRTFHRRLFAGMLETIRLIKREDDQREGVTRSYTLFQCRRSLMTKTGEPIRGEMTSDHRCRWHIPRTELDRVGIGYLNHLDTIVDGNGRFWQTESTTEIDVKMFSNHVDLACVRVDPPAAIVKED